ncbi:uncharacterized protein METZ01_LOCUS178321 [marine metagenome]|uniref:Uncharacterized protein n=1 Tax=marine metagenome TaxID=408172 RepID=A0A382CJG7_9ZZZZ
MKEEARLISNFWITRASEFNVSIADVK